MKTQSGGFLKAYRRVKTGKKILSDKKFIKYKSNKTDNLNSLGNFFSDEKISFQKLQQIEDQFKEKKYKLTKYICVILPKGIDSYRPILIPAPRDRILFSYILDVIKKNLLNEINQYNIFGSGERIDLPNIKKIIEEIQKQSKKHKYILKLDICKFFPSINQKILFSRIKKHIKNDYVLEIIKKSFNNKIEPKFTNNFSIENKRKIISSLDKGIPQGCAYSPLLANFYALPLDKIVKKLGNTSFRYLDDMIIFTESKKEAQKIFKKLKTVAKPLKLKIYDINKSGNKTYIKQANHTFEYLGIEIKSNGTFSIPLKKIKKEISLIKIGIFNKTTIERFGSKRVLNVLNSQFSGWKRYYQTNFPSAYLSIENRDSYNKKLKEYYKSILYCKRSIKKELLSAGFEIDNSKFYF